MTLLIREHSSSSYAHRTWANASEADLTIAIAVDYTTAGEKLTKKAATKRGDEHFLALDPRSGSDIDLARILYRHMRKHNFHTTNVAGNGIYTWVKEEYTQREINALVFCTLKLVHDYWPIKKVISGGQTGTDLAGGYAGWKLGIDTVMTLPKGFLCVMKMVRIGSTLWRKFGRCVRGRIMNNACACLGTAYGEPYCYCEMQLRGLESFMDNNRVRKAAEYDSAQQWKKFIAEGGFEQLTRKNK